MKKVFKYKYVFIIFSLILLIVSLFFTNNLKEKLIEFEANDIDNYMRLTLNNLKNKEYLSKFIEDKKVKNKYENDVSYLNGYISFFTNNEISYLKIDENVYEISNGNNALGTITLKSYGEESILGLLNYENLSVDAISLHEGIYDVDIYINNSYKVFINDNLVSKDDIVSINNYENIKSYPDLNIIPKIIHYKISDLIHEPKIKIINEFDEEVPITIQDGVIKVLEVLKIDDYEIAKKYIKNDFNPLEFAKNWSLYLTSDLNGKTGFYTLQPYLLKGTNLYTRAYNWSVNYDIYFTSPHTLAEEPFTNIIYNNFQFYNSNFFSVDISFDKNMILDNGEIKVDTLSEKFFFGFINNNYKLLDMKTIHN